MLVNEDQAHSYFTGPMVKIIVGEDDASKTFYVHHDLMISRSRFFRNALKNYGEAGGIVWLESEEGIVRLPEADPKVFARYVQLLYQGQLPIYKTIPNGDAERDQTPGLTMRIIAEQEYEHLAELYTLCDMLQDSDSQEFLIHAFVEMSQKVRANKRVYFPTYNTIRSVYNGTTESDPLRELLVDFYVYNADSRWFDDVDMDDFPRHFMNAVVKCTFTERGRPKMPEKLRNASFYCEKLRDTNKTHNEDP